MSILVTGSAAAHTAAAAHIAGATTGAAAATPRTTPLPPPDLVLPGAGERIAMILPGAAGFNGQRFAADAERYLAASRGGRGSTSGAAGAGSGDAAGAAGGGDGSNRHKLPASEICAEIYRHLNAMKTGQQDPADPRSFQRVRAALQSDDPRLREFTLEQLHTIIRLIFHNGIPPSFGPVIAHLAGPLLHDARPKTRECAAHLFAALATATGFDSDLLSLLSDSSPRVREAAAKAMATHGQGSGALPEELIPLLSDSRPVVRVAALRAIIALRLTPEGAKAISHRILEIARQDPSPECRGIAIELLDKLGVAPDTTEQLLIKQIRGGKGFALRHVTVDVLAKVMPHADSPAIAEAIAAQLQQKNPATPKDLRIAFITALGRMPQHALITAQTIATQLDFKAFHHWRVREAAAKALGRLGPAAGEALPRLRSLADHDDIEAVRVAAGAAARKIESAMAELN